VVAAATPQKKPLKKVTGKLAVLDKPVGFGGVSIGKNTGRISVSIDRSYVALDEAADLFSNRRLTGKVVLGRTGDATNQTKMVDDLDHEVSGAFDVKGFRVTEETISLGMTFALAEINIAELAKFSKGVGRLVAFDIGEIPPKPKAEKASNPNEVPGALKADGPWAKVSLDDLFDPKKSTRKTLAKANLNTVGELSDYQAKKGDFWAKDLDGCGPKMRQEIEDRLIKFWADNPDASKG
jgi:hypothetical protein